jgi:glycerol-3-phosphate O-acyltransferase / dihydroxyacetone phosphate acyltransferase
MLWHILKYYLCFIIAIFFKRSKIKNAHFLRVKGPVIIAMNHPNAFMDPVAFSTLTYPPKVHYLARGDAFKKGIVTAILESLGIIPIFRIQDGGKEGLKKNDETYERVNTLLKRNKKIIIFAEGLCIQERRLRPLKKGVPRMIFGAMETHNLTNLTVVPVGINYSNPSQFRSNVFFNVGEPIKVSDYMDAYKELPAKTMNEFLADLTPKMKELIINIDDKKHEKVIEHIEEIYKYDFFKKENLNINNLEHDFIYSTKIAEVFNNADETKTKTIDVLAKKTSAYFLGLKKLGLRDWLFNASETNQLNYFLLIIRTIAIICTLPFYNIGKIGSYIPYKLTSLITEKKVKVIEFKASFNMGIGALLFLIYYILQFIIIYLITNNSLISILIIILFVLCSIFSLYFSPFRKKTIGIFRILKLKKTNQHLYLSLTNQRKEIIQLFEQLV